jgi:type IV secretory pathway ATPase VirB11/archaellum biosynthesis ATPase
LPRTTKFGCQADLHASQFIVHIYYIGQVKISLRQPVLAFYLPDGQVVQKVNVEPWRSGGGRLRGDEGEGDFKNRECY